MHLWVTNQENSFSPASTERPSPRSHQFSNWFHWQGAAVRGEGHKIQGDPFGGRSHSVQHLHRPQRQAGEGDEHRRPPRHLRLHQGDAWNGKWFLKKVTDFHKWSFKLLNISFIWKNGWFIETLSDYLFIDSNCATKTLSRGWLRLYVMALAS